MLLTSTQSLKMCCFPTFFFQIYYTCLVFGNLNNQVIFYSSLYLYDYLMNYIALIIVIIKQLQLFLYFFFKKNLTLLPFSNTFFIHYIGTTLLISKDHWMTSLILCFIRCFVLLHQLSFLLMMLINTDYIFFE